MGFEEHAIKAIRYNRSLQAKQSTFGISADTPKDHNLNVKKAKVNEKYMAHLVKVARQKELVIWIFSIASGLAILYGVLF